MLLKCKGYERLGKTGEMSEIRRDDGDLVSNQDWNLGLDLEQKKYDDGKTHEIQIKAVI